MILFTTDLVPGLTWICAKISRTSCQVFHSLFPTDSASGWQHLRVSWKSWYKASYLFILFQFPRRQTQREWQSKVSSSRIFSRDSMSSMSTRWRNPFWIISTSQAFFRLRLRSSGTEDFKSLTCSTRCSHKLPRETRMVSTGGQRRTGSLLSFNGLDAYILLN